MPEIPEGAKRPDDHQSAQIKPEQHAEGWSLLRPPIDLEFWEITDFTAMVAEIPTRGDKVKLDAAALRTVGALVKMLQETFAKNSAEFRAWTKQGTLAETAEKLLPLIFEYAGALGEAVGSETN